MKSGVVFTDVLAAMVCYYGAYHVLTGYDLSDNQRASCAAVIADAKNFLTANGHTPFVPLSVMPEVEKSTKN